MWEQVLDSMPRKDQVDLFQRIKKLRRRAIPISLNGKTDWVARRLVQEWLRKKLADSAEAGASTLR